MQTLKEAVIQARKDAECRNISECNKEMALLLVCNIPIE